MPEALLVGQVRVTCQCGPQYAQNLPKDSGMEKCMWEKTPTVN